MKVIIFGATGMVGQGVLRECLLAEDVERVLVVGRTPTGRSHPRLTELMHADFADLSAIEGVLGGYDACFYCLGVSAAGRDEAEYTRITHDYTLAAARPLARLSPNLVFVYVSGAGTDAQGRAMWAKVKGRTENEVLELFPNGYAFRPGIIQPTYGATSKTRWYRMLYAAMAPLTPVLQRLFPAYVTTSDRLGRAMLRVARTGSTQRILTNADLR
ncbi:NAD-dependent epimerase/dehydratase family protein [Streptomyces sp. NPDC026665]|uniref:NAD-dependent epimerase/dehydratase family protein n=1 Tax=Streptomyces sp. NPDC026665 TaxID=3154798 RepID=UPI0033D7AA37